MIDVPIQAHVNKRARAVLGRAGQHCDKLLGDVRAICDAFLAGHNLTPEDVCWVVVGSVGRSPMTSARI